MPFDTAQIKKPLPEAYAEGGGCLLARATFTSCMLETYIYLTLLRIV